MDGWRGSGSLYGHLIKSMTKLRQLKASSSNWSSPVHNVYAALSPLPCQIVGKSYQKSLLFCSLTPVCSGLSDIETHQFVSINLPETTMPRPVSAPLIYIEQAKVHGGKVCYKMVSG